MKVSNKLKILIDTVGALRDKLKETKEEEETFVSELKKLLPDEAPEERLEGIAYSLKVIDVVMREPDKEKILDYFLGELSEETRAVIKMKMLPVISFKMEELSKSVPANKLDTLVNIKGTSRRLSFDTK